MTFEGTERSISTAVQLPDPPRLPSLFLGEQKAVSFGSGLGKG